MFLWLKRKKLLKNIYLNKTIQCFKYLTYVVNIIYLKQVMHLKKILEIYYNFIFGCSVSLLLHTGFLQFGERGYLLSSHCSGIFCSRVQALGAQASIFAALGLQSTGCGAWSQLLPGMWDLLGPGVQLVSLARQGGFITIGLSGKPQVMHFISQIHI